ncbi:MAG TPA: cation acetate symporter, partial [Planktothrix sp. UBA10369]|nr:cation acetate symporter [Planktothrix sp. UBA10369]
LKNPGLITIPLSFAVGIIVSLLKSDRQAYAKFAEVEQLIHISDLQFPSTLPAKDIDVEL